MRHREIESSWAGASIKVGGERKEAEDKHDRFQASAPGYMGVSFPNLKDSWKKCKSKGKLDKHRGP